MAIKIIQIGSVQPNILEPLIEGLNESLENRFVLDRKMDIPKEAYDKFKDQYIADVILNKMTELKTKSDENLVGVTSSDLYASGLNFIFGQAVDNSCIVSTARLDPQFYKKESNFDLLIKRFVKEVIHELGHIFGLEHCKNLKCVMCFSNSVEDVDRKDKDFCDDCKLKMTMRGVEI